MERPDWAEHGPTILNAVYAMEAINTSGLRARIIGNLGAASVKFRFNEVSNYFSTPISEPIGIDDEHLDDVVAAGIEHALVVDRYLEPIARGSVDALEASFKEPEGVPDRDHPYYRSFDHTFAFASLRSVLAYIDPSTRAMLNEAKNLAKQQRNLREGFENRTIVWNRRTNGGRR